MNKAYVVINTNDTDALDVEVFTSKRDALTYVQDQVEGLDVTPVYDGALEIGWDWPEENEDIDVWYDGRVIFTLKAKNVQ